MSAITIAAPAKCNLHLEVLGRDTAGYHLLETVFQTLAWADVLTVGPTETGLQLRCSDPDLPADDGNLAFRAAAMWLARRPGLGGLRIDLDKHLPAGGGLGGGSSDAAAVLRALDRLDPDGLTPEEVHAIASDLGSDVPFFLHGGTAHATGRGEVLTPLPDAPATTLSLVVPELHCSTPAVFQALTEAERGPREALGPEVWAQRLAADLPGCLHNRLAAAAMRAYPDLAAVAERCAASGHPWLVSGSGACCVVLGAIEPWDGVRVVRTAFRARGRLDMVD